MGPLIGPFVTFFDSVIFFTFFGVFIHFGDFCFDFWFAQRILQSTTMPTRYITSFWEGVINFWGYFTCPSTYSSYILLTDCLHVISRYVRYQASPVSPDPSPNDYYYGQRVEQPTASVESSINSAQPSSSSSGSFEKPQPTYDPTYRYKREAKQPFSHLAWSHWHICRQKVQGKTFYFAHMKIYEKREAIR